MFSNIEIQVRDTQEIERVVTGYGVLHDQKNYEALGDLFDENAKYSLTVTGGTVIGPIVGRRAIVDQIRKFKIDQTGYRRHHITNIQVQYVEQNRAKCVAYVMVTLVEHEQVELVTVGTYYDELVKFDGIWKIIEKKLFLDRDFN